MSEGHRNPVPTVDVIIEIGAAREVVLIERKNEPHGWALPGGFVDYGETLPDAARREAEEETGLAVTLELLLGVYSDPARDPRLHTMSTVYVGGAAGEPVAADDAINASTFAIDALPALLCFDHRKILDDYLVWRETGRRPAP